MRRHSLEADPSGPQIAEGVALLETGNITCPPASASCCSRCNIVCNWSGPGSVDTIPGKLALGIRTPGISSLTANSLSSRQIAKNWPSIRSRIKPPLPKV